MSKNSFKLLEEEMEAKFADSSSAVKRNINSRKGMWILLGDLIDLYVPRIFKTFIVGVSFSNRLGDGNDEIAEKE